MLETDGSVNDPCEENDLYEGGGSVLTDDTAVSLLGDMRMDGIGCIKSS